MACSSALALMPSPPSSPSSQDFQYTGEWEHDVFLCFRGADTRHGFTSHLMAALSDKQIKAFIDGKLRKTECIDELLSILQKSALSIVIFSENFADSTWCLEEVAMIARRYEKFGHRVLPVFYKVDPSDVAGDSGRYAAAIDHKHGASRYLEDRKRWKVGLKTVANCVGHTSQSIEIESDLIREVVNDVQRQLTDMSPSIMPDNLVGIDSRIMGIKQLLAMNTLDGTRVIGLWGMGGSGKTTLATACYQRFVCSMRDTKHYFFKRINESCESVSGIEGLIQELYSTLLSEKGVSRETLDIRFRRTRLSRLKVFIVLDDVEAPSQLDQLLLGSALDPTTLFAAGSRIIVTTRNKRVLQYARAKIYVVDGLRKDESLQLFSLHSFRQRSPPSNWKGLSRQAISYCGGNPLALRVLGSRLFGEDQNYWNSFLGDLEPGIHNVLVRSYLKLGADEQRLFLDFACFHKVSSRSRMTKYMTSKYGSHAYSRIKDLIDKSMFICFATNGYEHIHVHDLLREMAWRIVNDERKLENRARLYNPEDVHKLFTNREHSGANVFQGVIATEAICLDISKAKEMDLKPNAFEGMHSLTYLVFWYPRAVLHKSGSLPSHLCNIRLPDNGLDSLPNELRYLRWDGFPSESLPSRFNAEYLCYLEIHHSPIVRCWEGVEPSLVNLVSLDLSYCIHLSNVPDLSKSANLEVLVLRGCESLVELPLYLSYDKLTLLDLRDCQSLSRLPTTFNFKSLKSMYLSNCPKVIRCPEVNSGELVYLDLMDTPVRKLPSAIYNVKQGGVLRLCGKRITNFPAIAASLNLFRLCHTTVREMDIYDEHQVPSKLSPRFVRLELVGNSELKRLSRNIWKMVSQTLLLAESPLIESLPEISEPFNHLTELAIIRCQNLKSFPIGISNLKSLQVLHFVGTDVKSLPSWIEELDQLSTLDLSFNKGLEFVSSNICKLANLSILFLKGCSRIQSLPELPPNLDSLHLGGCKSLRVLPSNYRKLRWKRVLFDDCTLDANSHKEMVETFPNQATVSPHLQGGLQYWGSEIPEWFAYKSMNDKDDSRVMVQLPTCNSNRRIKGIAFCIVCSSDIFIYPLCMKCNCDIETTTAGSWSSPDLHLGGTTSSSDNVYMWFDKNLLGETPSETLSDETNEGMRDEAEPWYVKYAGVTVSFRFSFLARKEEDVKNLRKAKLKRLGISLLY
ncbi:unnamed protein product [Linum trigynum]|uniref:ADP-ribosyl cyclase/cyclic ADP-ribose hydrolase n=1 Tax=Linum trigynum TaxID=586398 RepID=A0AAV2D243_9ROSI